MIADELKKFLTPKISVEEAYKRGYDAGLHGSNDTNTNFAIFNSEEKRDRMERGKE